MREVSSSSLPLGRFPIVRTTRLEEASETFGRLHTPVKIDRHDRSAPFAWRSNSVAIGGLVLFASEYGGGFRASAEGATDAFTVSLPLAPVTAEVVSGNRTIPIAARRTSWLGSPSRCTVVHIGAG